MKNLLFAFCVLALIVNIFTPLTLFSNTVVAAPQKVDTISRLIGEIPLPSRDTNVYVKTIGGNGVPMYFTMSDTQPGMPMYSPHISLSYGNPTDLHAMMSLESNKVYGESDMVAVFGIIDNGGDFNATILADTAAGEFIRIQAKNESGRGKYKFTPMGIEFARQASNGTWMLSNKRAVPGNVLQYTSGDTAKFQMFTYQNIDSVTLYRIPNPAIGQTAFCTDCTPKDNSEGGVVVTYNGKLWRRQW